MTDAPGLAQSDAIGIGDDTDHTEEWVEQVPTVDRVISVALSVEQPRTVDWIADQAEVSPTTARDHLERLVDLHVLSTVEKGGAKTYYPDAAYQRFTEISKLVEEHSREELETMVVQAKEWIDELKETYQVGSPDELRKKATTEESSPAEAKEYFKKASEWGGHRHMLSIAEQAIDRYREFDQNYYDQHSHTRTPV